MQLSSPQKISQKNKIPPATIRILSQILPKYYLPKNLDALFFYTPSAPHEYRSDDDEVKIKKRLDTINVECNKPLEVLGPLLGDFLDSEFHKLVGFIFQDIPEDQMLQQLKEDQRKVLETLKKDGLEYQRGGYIIKNELTFTQELQKAGLLSMEELKKLIAEKELSAVEIEINRALENIEKDPREAVLFAANLLEASCKAYLDHHSILYEENAHNKLYALWKEVAKKAKIHTDDIKQKNLKNQDLDKNDLRMIATGLSRIVSGTMNLRNKKSAAHGRSEKDFELINLKPRHARLTFNAAHSLSIYILELMDQP
ncbi:MULTISPECIES: abortive infection family protein [unclassified Bartonella]|uniref:abortive infection family protein n=1 Tax=unclassified Bartonella TaxID=2645622 RepID=UPI0035CF8932